MSLEQVLRVLRIDLRHPVGVTQYLHRGAEPGQGDAAGELRKRPLHRPDRDAAERGQGEHHDNGSEDQPTRRPTHRLSVGDRNIVSSRYA